MKLKRKEAVEILTYLELIFEYDIVKRKEIISNFSYTDDSSKKIDFEKSKFNKLILSSLKSGYKGVVNSYIEIKIFNFLKINVEIEDEDFSLLECLCCGYQTIAERGNYEICPICFWEDDGNNDTQKYSSVNKMSLTEAKGIYSNLGVISNKFYEYKNDDLKLRYHKK